MYFSRYGLELGTARDHYFSYYKVVLDIFVQAFAQLNNTIFKIWKIAINFAEIDRCA